MIYGFGKEKETDISYRAHSMTKARDGKIQYRFRECGIVF